MKQVRETKAGQSISAWVVLKNGKEVATVQAYFADSGGVLVNVWDKSNGYNMQYGKAGGYGYDKFTAALSGLTIDGIKMTNHCATNELTEKILADYQKEGHKSFKKYEAKALKIGARFANYGSFTGKKNVYGSLYLESGLDRLSALGYTVIKAI